MSLRHYLLRLGLCLCWLSAASAALATEPAPQPTAPDDVDPVDRESFGNEQASSDSEESDASFSVIESSIQAPELQTLDPNTVDRLDEPTFTTDFIASPLPTSPLPTSPLPTSPLPASPLPTSLSSISPLQEGLANDSLEQTATLPQWVEAETAEEATFPTLALEEAFTVFPVGINVGDRNILPTALIKGSETSSVAFEQWLIPFDSVTQALSIAVTVLDSGKWELRSPSLIIRLSPEDLQTDSDLGLVLSIAQIQTLLGVSAQFEQLDYAIRFEPPINASGQRYSQSEKLLLTEGLPLISPAPLGISGISQATRIAGRSNRETDIQSDFSAVGTVAGGSWYARTEQPEIGDLGSWRLSEFQYLRQREETDLALGSQPTFWPSQSRESRDYWGATYVQRWGFSPAEDRGRNGFDPQRRLQAKAVGRTVSGEAEPGTLVRLTQGIRETILDEVLVDSSGIYRFENVASNRGTGRYQVLLYPNGQLTALPEVRTASFSSLPGQLPAGASALIVTGGVGRETDGFSSRSNDRSSNRSNGNSASNWLGDFGDFRGGVAYQRGLTESLTVGAGFIQDENPHILAEAFYAPDGLPLKMAVSTLSDLKTSKVSVNANVQYRPSKEVYMTFNSDRLSQRFSSEWKVRKGLTLLAQGDTRDKALTGGAKFHMNEGDFFLFGNATFDTKSRLRWGLNARKGPLGIRHFGNENTTQSELFYALSDRYAYGDGHGLIANYETHQLNGGSNQVGTLSYRYRSKQRANDGRPKWDMQLGYGIGSNGSGVVASVSTAVLPGVEIRAQYRGVSAFSDDNSFQIEFRPRLNFQGGLSFANKHQDRLRTQGGLLLQPFLDNNSNGVRDNGESVISDNLDLLLSVNYEDLSQYRPDIRKEGTFITLPPDMYRVDLDSAGYPLDWQAAETAYAVSTTAGQYTPVEIPFSRAYSLIGTVVDSEEKALAGQRVEAIDIESERRFFSITNTAGVFYIEGLSTGNYRFEVGGKAGSEGPITFDETTEGLQEINFHLLPDEIKTQRVLPEVETIAEQEAVLI